MLSRLAAGGVPDWAGVLFLAVGKKPMAYRMYTKCIFSVFYIQARLIICPSDFIVMMEASR